MKKIIALTLIFIIAISGTAFADMKTVKEDLTKYNIITDFESETINRAEAVKIIVTMLGHYDLDRKDTEFSDVRREYWASGYIAYAIEAGIVNGNGDGTFEPEEKVTNEQMVKMLVNALGYEPSVRGNYPIAHFKKAGQLGITEGLDLVGSEIAKRSDVAVMVHNAFDTPIMVQTLFGSYTSYSIMNGEYGTKRITLRTKLNTENDLIEDTDSSGFSSQDYTGRIVRITDLKKTGNIYEFKNGLNTNDNSVYIINESTKIHESNNVLPLDDIKDGLYAQCWYKLSDEQKVELTKIEIMKNKPQGID